MPSPAGTRSPPGSAPMATERPQSNTWVSQLSWNTPEHHQDLMRWQCIVSKASRGSTAVFHSPLIKILLMGSEEDKPPLTGLTLVQVVKENYFCWRTNLPYSTEILIRVNIKGVAGWHSCSAYTESMETQRNKKNTDLTLNLESRVKIKLKIKECTDLLLHRHCAQLRLSTACSQV